MSDITKHVCVTVRTEINNALAEITKKHGISFELGGMSYSSDQLTVKITGINQNKSSNTVSQKELDFKTHHGRFGLEATLLNTFFNAPNGKIFKIVGLAPRSFKYPVIGQDPKGKEYKLPIAWFK